MARGTRPGNETRAAKDRLAANLSRLMVRADLTTDELARRSGLDPDTVRSILLGEDDDPDVSTVVILAGAAGGTIADLVAGIAWIPHGGRPGGEYKVESID